MGKRKSSAVALCGYRSNPVRLAAALLLIQVAVPAHSQRNMHRDPRIAGAAKVAEEFFEDIRDSHFEEAYNDLDPAVQKQLGRRKTLEALAGYRRSIYPSGIDEKFTFMVRDQPLEATACVEADVKKKRTVYMTARLVWHGPSNRGWKIRQFRFSAAPSEGCPS